LTVGQMDTFDSRILWYREELMVDSNTVRFPAGPVAAKFLVFF